MEELISFHKSNTLKLFAPLQNDTTFILTDGDLTYAGPLGFALSINIYSYSSFMDLGKEYKISTVKFHMYFDHEGIPAQIYGSNSSDSGFVQLATFPMSGTGWITTDISEPNLYRYLSFGASINGAYKVNEVEVYTEILSAVVLGRPSFRNTGASVSGGIACGKGKKRR